MGSHLFRLFYLLSGCFWLGVSIVSYLVCLPLILVSRFYSGISARRYISRSFVADYLNDGRHSAIFDGCFSGGIKGISLDDILDVTLLKGGYNNRLIRYSIRNGDDVVDVVAKIYLPAGSVFSLLAKFFTPMPIGRSLSSRERMMNEYLALRDLSMQGVRVPDVYFADEQNGILWVQYVLGKSFYDIFGGNGGSAINESDISKYVAGCAKIISCLHGMNLSLVDCSVSNFILGGDEIFLVDLETTRHGHYFEWDVASFLYSMDRFSFSKKDFVSDCFFSDYNVINFDYSKCLYIRYMLKAYRVVDVADNLLRYGNEEKCSSDQFVLQGS